ncbi:hypothetical protein AAF712_005682 [Marasmius tenuissimus]|uniref:Uncharacterized protein n=1 Tax=Marasmius tenuissimus TaxID=585030 RepID=A0ABR3A2N0_9AGAR
MKNHTIHLLFSSASPKTEPHVHKDTSTIHHPSKDSIFSSIDTDYSTDSHYNDSRDEEKGYKHDEGQSVKKLQVSEDEPADWDTIPCLDGPETPSHVEYTHYEDSETDEERVMHDEFLTDNRHEWDDQVSQHTGEPEARSCENLNQGFDGLYKDGQPVDAETNDLEDETDPEEYDVEFEGHADGVYYDDDGEHEQELYDYEDNQSGYQSGEDLGNYLILAPQHFPRLLWPLHHPKLAYHHQPPNKDPLCESTAPLPSDIVLHNTISSHAPFLVTLAVFQLLLESTCILFVQNLQTARHFT